MIVRPILPDQTRRILGHFYMAHDEQGSTLTANDGFCFIAGALCGLSPADSSKSFFDLTVKGSYRPQRDSILNDLVSMFRAAVRDDARNFFLHPVYSHRNYHAVSEQLEGVKQYRIKYWVSTSSILAALSLYAAHIHKSVWLFNNGEKESAVKAARDAAMEYMSYCRMVNVAIQDGGSYALMDFHVRPADEDTVLVAQSVFLHSLFFIACHEMVHICMGHLDHSPGGIDRRTKFRNEIEADSFAFHFISEISSGLATSPLLGAAMALLGDSLTNTKPSADDARNRESHPSLVTRVKVLCQRHEQTHGLSEGESWFFVQPYACNMAINLFDRDRSPAWCGKPRDEILPPGWKDQVEAGPRRNYHSTGRFSMLGLGEQPTKKFSIPIPNKQNDDSVGSG